MKKTHLYILFLLAVILGSLSLEGCSRNEKKGHLTGTGLNEEIVRIYANVNPVSASMLGIRSSDSLLFSFDGESIDAAISELKQLQARIENLRGGRMEEKEDLLLVLYWLKGQIYALKELESYSYNPLLYAWIIEHSLLDIPERPQKPYRGEYESYVKRIKKLIPFMEQSRSLLVNPATLELKSSIERINGIIEKEEYLKGLLRRRYGKIPEETLNSVFESVQQLEEELETKLGDEPRNRTILGLEELSRIIFYDESINMAPNALIREAERMIRTLKVRRNFLRKKVSSGENPAAGDGRNNAGIRNNTAGDTPESGKKLLGLIQGFKSAPDEAKAEQLLRLYRTIEKSVSGGLPMSRKSRVDAVPIESSVGSGELSKNCLLSLPMPRRKMVYASTPTPFTGAPRSVTLYFDRRLSTLGPEEIIYNLLGVTSPVLKPALSLLSPPDTIRSMLSSETYRHGWYFVKMKRLIEKLPWMRNELLSMLMDEKIKAMSMMITALELNSGTMTLEEAIDKYMEFCGADIEEAEREVTTAATTPSSIYPGASIVIVDRLYRLISSRMNVEDPRRKLEETLLDRPFTPVMLIFEKVKE